MVADTPHGPCGHCGKPLRVTRTGGVYSHRGVNRSRCPGSGQPPAASRAATISAAIDRLEQVPVHRISGHAVISVHALNRALDELRAALGGDHDAHDA